MVWWNFCFFSNASKEREKHANASSRLQIKSTRNSYLATTTSVKHAIKYSRIIILITTRRRRRFLNRLLCVKKSYGYTPRVKGIKEIISR